MCFVPFSDKRQDLPNVLFVSYEIVVDKIDMSPEAQVEKRLKFCDYLSGVFVRDFLP